MGLRHITEQLMLVQNLIYSLKFNADFSAMLWWCHANNGCMKMLGDSLNQCNTCSMCEFKISIIILIGFLC